MYPYEIIFNMNLYDIFLAVGVVSALLFARIFADRDKVSAKLFNFILLNGIVAIVIGYLSAVFTQAVYNWLDGEAFVINAGTGATFLGGLTGGVITYLVGYFVIGYFVFPKRENLRYFPRLLDIASISITSAHGFGRLGCLMVGCCHGAETCAWYGIYHVDLGKKVVPIQLFEAMFLFALCAILIVLVIKKKPGAMSLYMLTYGIWRFAVEFFRADDRGSTFVDFLSPSQLVSVLLVVGSVFVYFLTLKLISKFSDKELTDE
jgi:phosphatidylglycerol:prolipoprotein diacylglycerol transferase